MQAVWVEIPVRDITRALEFYRAVFALSEIEVRDDGVRKTATLTVESGVGVSLTQNPAFHPSENGLYVYLTPGDDAQSALARVEEAGGHIVVPITSMGDAGNYATIRDTEGNSIGIYLP